VKRPVPTLLCLLLLSSGLAWPQPTPNGDDFVVNAYTRGEQWYPKVASSGAGAFVVFWETYLQDGDHHGIFGQLFDSSGGRVGAESLVSVSTLGSQDQADVGMDDSGGFVVVWYDTSKGVLGRRFDTTGAPITGEF
jgi:hypothetical protein